MVKLILLLFLKLHLLVEPYDISDFDKEQFKLINEYREQNDLPSLIWSTELYILAQEKTKHMIKYDYFSHTSPAGITLRQRLHNTHGKAENLARGFKSSKKCLETLKNSPKHNENLLDSRSTKIGIYTEDSYTTQIFGNDTIS